MNKTMSQRGASLDQRRGAPRRSCRLGRTTFLAFVWLLLLCVLGAVHYSLVRFHNDDTGGGGPSAAGMNLLSAPSDREAKEKNDVTLQHEARHRRRPSAAASRKWFDQETKIKEASDEKVSRKIDREASTQHSIQDDTTKKAEEAAKLSAYHHEDETITQLITFDMRSCQGKEIDRQDVKGGDPPVSFLPEKIPKSVLVRGGGVVEVHRDKIYRGTVMEVEGCVDLYLMGVRSVQFTLLPVSSAAALTSTKQIPDSLQKQFSTTTKEDNGSSPHTRIVFSSTSCEYFGYQLFASAMGFLQSNQTNASWMRLLTAQKPDDLSERFPTFTAPQSLYSKQYSPINKADVIDKWLHSKDAPHPDDTIVVVDPDNWLLKDVHEWTTEVSSKRAVGELAYYQYDPKITEIWQDICQKNCNQKIDPVGVPYFVKASDLKEIAPLWRSYSIDIHQRMKNDATFKSAFGSLGIEWSAEMVGYNAACAHLQIQTKVINNGLQVRDVATSRNWDRWSKVPMIHMGRAWFPKEAKELAAPWVNEDDNGFSENGIQVWCKCNLTAAKIQPWPLPENNMDFVSYHTLRLLHESKIHFGPVPVNEEFRREELPYATMV